MQFRYSTIAQNVTALRRRFAESRGVRACRLAKWLLGRTDAQLRTAFGVTQGQIAALRTRLQERADAGDAADGKAGE
jgi:hypothetical protein